MEMEYLHYACTDLHDIPDYVMSHVKINFLNEYFAVQNKLLKFVKMLGYMLLAPGYGHRVKVTEWPSDVQTKWFA